MEDEFIFPVEPSPKDNRDYKYCVVRPFIVSPAKIQTSNFDIGTNTLVIPETLNLQRAMLKPRSQGSRGTCAAFAAAAIKEYQERIDINFQDYMSPEYIYYWRTNKPNDGMHCRDVMKILAQYGSIPEKDLPYGTEEINEIPDEVIATGSNFKINNYALVQTVKELKETLVKNGPCLAAFPVYSVRPEFWRKASNDDPQKGGHAVCIVGYNHEGFIIRNSWGSNWNDNGTVVYPYEDFGAHWEIWCAIDINVEEWLANKKWYAGLLCC
jgi:hypothetical protein